MREYISRDLALNFETSVECEPENLSSVMEGMARYAEYLKGLPVERREPVLRCRACRFYGAGVRERGSREYCMVNRRAVDAWDFCSEGAERHG